ncbi:hypothetical protein Vwe01_55040 [Micromonospora andamanensis]|nr:hypothetical protein Vwe01_55040 [Micromonospora andamanensis]
MRSVRAMAGLTAAVAAVLGLGLATAGPAAADEAGTWRAYGNTNPITSSSASWHCGQSVTVVSGVSAQPCMIRGANLISVQGAVIVRNNRSSLYNASASVHLRATEDPRGSWV